MNILTIIKKSAALLLLVCLFLPLSTCTKTASPQLPGHKEEKVMMYVIPDKEGLDWKRFLPAVLFCLPALLMLAGIFTGEALIKLQLFDIFAALGILSILAVHHFFGALAIGGWFSLLAAISYLLSSMISIIIIIKTRAQ